MSLTKLLLLIFFYTYFSYGQNITSIDSLKVDNLYKKAKDSIYENTTKSFSIANQILELSNKEKYDRGVVKANLIFGLGNYVIADYQQSVFFYQKAINLARNKNYIEDLSSSLNSISSVYVVLTDYEKALTACYEALNIRLKNKDTTGSIKCYQQLADCFFRKKDFKKASIYINKVITPQVRRNLPRNYSDALRLKAIILIEQKKYELALQNLHKAKIILDSIGDNRGALIVNSDIASTFFQMKDFDHAEKSYKELLYMDEFGDDVITHLVVLHNLGALYLEKNNLILSEKYLNESLLIAQQVNSYDYLQLVYNSLSDLYFAKGNYKKAYTYKETFLAYSDSVMNNEKMKTIEELTVKFETKQVAEQNKFLQIASKLDKAEVKQKNLILLVLALFVASSGLFIFFFIKRSKENARNKNNELRQKLLLSQMNPHFIFNSVDNIQSLIYNNQNKEAISYLTKFSKLTRQILENSNENNISLLEELSMTENYLTIQQLLYNNNFIFEITVDEKIDTESILIPPMLTQPFIENAVKHGLRNTTEGGFITIKFYMAENKLFFEVEDNGSGMATEEKKSIHKSLATQIVTERLQNNASKKTIIINTKNIIENNIVKGVRTTFEIPYICDN